MDDHSGLAPPVPISNTDVKQTCVSGCTAFQAGTLIRCPPLTTMKRTLLTLVAAATLSCGGQDKPAPTMPSSPSAITFDSATNTIVIDGNLLAEQDGLNYDHYDFVAVEQRLIERGYTRCDSFLGGFSMASLRAEGDLQDTVDTDYEIVDRGRYEMGGMIDDTHHFVAYKKSKQ